MKHHVYQVKFHDVKHQIKTINIYASSFDAALIEAKKQLERINHALNLYELYSVEKTSMEMILAIDDQEVSHAVEKLQTIADSMLKNA